jgi:hypothetical protein
VSLHESFVDDGLGLKGKSKRKVVMGNVCSASRVLMRFLTFSRECDFPATNRTQLVC